MEIILCCCLLLFDVFIMFELCLLRNLVFLKANKKTESVVASLRSELLMTGSHELPVSQAKIVSIIGKNQNNRYRIRPPQDSELSVPERLCRTSLLHPVWTVLPSHPSMDGDIRNACSDTHAPSEDVLSAYRI